MTRFPLFSLVLMVGCGCAKADLSGRISYNGKPVSFGTVQAFGSDGRPVSASIQPDGSYSLRALALGEARLAVSTSDPTLLRTAVIRAGRQRPAGAASPLESEPPQIAPSQWFPLPEQYRSVDTSGLTATIKQGSNTFDINLK
jgi:hypothetical protein